jgi:hypothetical protein
MAPGKRLTQGRIINADWSGKSEVWFAIMTTRYERGSIAGAKSTF